MARVDRFQRRGAARCASALEAINTRQGWRLLDDGAQRKASSNASTVSASSGLLGAKWRSLRRS